jgi:hypothetical protein
MSEKKKTPSWFKKNTRKFSEKELAPLGTGFLQNKKFYPKSKKDGK